MVEVSLTLGKLDASLALLLTKDHHLIEFPTILLPNGVKAGSIVKIKCDQDFETEKEEARQFNAIQDEILSTFGTNLPQNPVLKPVNVTQTSCVLEWEPLDLGTASLKNLFLFKDGKKLGTIPQPLTNRVTKLSGLPIDKTFNFQLRLDTTAGVYASGTIEVTTHKMTDLSGITVCLGDITANDQFTVDDIQETLKNMGAHYPAQDKVKVDTTHFICTRENKQNPEFVKASDMNIPIIRPEWLKACERDRRIVGVRDYYVKDCVLPDIFAKNFWQKTGKPSSVPSAVEATNDSEAAHTTATTAAEPPKTAADYPIHEINLENEAPEVPEKETAPAVEEHREEKTLPIPKQVEGAELPLIVEEDQLEESAPVDTEEPVSENTNGAELAQDKAEEAAEAILEHFPQEDAPEAADLASIEPAPVDNTETIKSEIITEAETQDTTVDKNVEGNDEATPETKGFENNVQEDEEKDDEAEISEPGVDAAPADVSEPSKNKKKNKKKKNKK